MKSVEESMGASQNEGLLMSKISRSISVSEEQERMSPEQLRREKLALSQRHFAANPHALPVHANTDSSVHSSHRRLSDGY
jgi:hypothetical protein